MTHEDLQKQVITHQDLFGTFDKALEGIEGSIPDASSGDGIIRTHEQCVEWAERLGCDMLQATDRQLFVDIDTEHHFMVFTEQVKLLKKHFYFKTWIVKPSKQGLPHRHITIEMGSDYPLMVRIALQACLGSDPMRELLSVRRAMNEEENVVIFFEKRSE